MKRHAVMTMILLTGLGAPARAWADQPAIQFFRVVLLDKSKSMAAENIGVARAELLEGAGQLPASHEMPILVVPFHARVDRVDWFFDPAAFRAFLDGLRPVGGTSIAAGLERLVEEVGPYRYVPHLMVQIYTDGEDPDHDAIERQRQRLSAFFAERQKLGLRQTVVFCKRFSNRSAWLVSAFKKGGAVRVIDAAELRFVPLTLTPSFALSRASWDDSVPPRLEVRVSAGIAVQGAADRSGLPKIGVQCVTPGASGDVDARVAPVVDGATTLDLRIDPDRARGGGQAALDFRIAEPVETFEGGRLLLPILPVNVVHLPVPVPVLSFLARLDASLTQSKAPRWVDAACGRAAVPVTLVLDVRQDRPGAWRGPATFRVGATDPACLVSGADTFTVTGPGRVTVPLSVETVLGPPDEPGRQGPLVVGLTVRPLRPPLGVSFEPAELHVSCGFEAPPLTTRVTTRLRTAERARWVDVGEGIVEFIAKADARVESPLSTPTVLSINGSTEDVRVRVEPEKLRPGYQSVSLRVRFRLPKEKDRGSLRLQASARTSQGTVELQEPSSWAITVKRPPRPRVALSRNGSILTTFDLVAATGDGGVTAEVTPTLVDVDKAVAGPRATASVTCSGFLRLVDGGSHLVLGRPAILRLTTTDRVTRPWLRDQIFEADLTVVPDSRVSVALESKHHVVLTVESVTTRFRTAIVIALTASAGILMLVGLALRLRRSTAQDIREPEFAPDTNRPDVVAISTLSA